MKKAPKVQKMLKKQEKSGFFLPIIMMLSVIFLSLIVATISMAMSNLKVANNHRDREIAMEVAEAGINYYLWHLAHNNTDYCDGQACTGDAVNGYGPYSHNYTDTAGKTIGSYEITLYPPNQDSNVVKIESVGKASGRTLKRKIISELGMPAYSKYTLFVQGEELWLGNNEEITGTVFVNGNGICNQGEITKDSYSTEQTYDSYACGNGTQGISGPGIFGGSKNYPVAPVDFSQLDIDMTTLRNDSQALGEPSYFDSSGSNGYYVLLKSNSFDLYRVTAYYGSMRDDQNNNADDLSIRNKTFLANYSYPESGVIYFEDNVWVDGQVDNQKITIAAYDPEESRNFFKKNIIVNNNLLFTNYDGSDKIGLISQNFIYVPRKAPATIRIDAAMIAYGSVGYSGAIRIKAYCNPTSSCNDDHKTKITVYGSMAHRGGLWWTMDYGGGKWSGYAATETIIDESNVLNPPPKFPVTGSYQILSWREE